MQQSAGGTPGITQQQLTAQEFYELGRFRSNHGNYDLALADYDEAIRLDPANYRAYYNRGLLRGSQGDPAGAKADDEEASCLRPPP